MEHRGDTRDRAVTRRQAVGIAGAAGAAVVLARASGVHGLLDSVGTETTSAATTSCTLTPSKTEGPYFVDEKLNRSDIRTDPGDGSVQDGVPLTLTFVVVRSDGDCAAVPGATVDIWHANAKGLYSDESANSTVGKKYLRGYQVTDDQGKAQFTTIYPGWYSGRAIHIHFKIRLFDGTSETYEFTSQLFFDPSTTSDVVQTSAYKSHGSPDTSNSSDNIYGSDGSQLLVPIGSDGNGGYAGTFTVGLSGLPSSTGSGTVDASVAAAKFRRTATGSRLLRVTLRSTETVTVTGRLARSGNTLVRRKLTGLRSGTRTMYLRVPRRVRGGSAQLVVRFEDAAGLTKTVRRTVTIPKRVV
jgi:protocatechuate 3,4-dioxygenase beta subunit